MPFQPTRRQCLAAAVAATASCWLGRRAVAAGPAGGTCTLSIGTYSLTGLSVEESIALLAETGYDGIEIATQPGFGGTPAEMSPERRSALRDLMVHRGLRLTALMEHLAPSEDDARHREDCQRLKQVFQLGQAIATGPLPLVQTVLGGGTWERKKQLYRDRLGDWLALAREARMVLAIKPHRGGAMSRPEEAIWLIEQLGNSPWLRLVYDYSHYAFRDMPVDQTVRTAAPFAAHVAVKDAVEGPEKIEFLPAGQSGRFDYPALFRQLYGAGYRGDICCEISAMVWKKPGYDPRATAVACYRRMSAAMAAAGIPRPQRGAAHY